MKGVLLIFALLVFGGLSVWLYARRDRKRKQVVVKPVPQQSPAQMLQEVARQAQARTQPATGDPRATPKAQPRSVVPPPSKPTPRSVSPTTRRTDDDVTTPFLTHQVISGQASPTSDDCKPSTPSYEPPSHSSSIYSSDSSSSSSSSSSDSGGGGGCD